MKRSAFILTVILMSVGNVYGTDLSSGETQSAAISLFSGGDVTSSSTLRPGDLVGVIFVGAMAYLTSVVFFLIGIFGIGPYFFKGPGNSMTDNTSGMNFIRLALKPLAWLVAGAMIFAFMKMFLEGLYDINIASRTQFFLEARYDVLVDNLQAHGTMLKVAQFLLMILDLSSKFAFWSIVVLYVVLVCFVLMLFIAIMAESGNAEVGVWKRLFSGGMAVGISSAITGAYILIIDTIMFKNPVNISGMSHPIASAAEAIKESIILMIRMGLGLN